MDLHYSPVTQCERGAYDSLWRSVVSELGRSSGSDCESIILSDVFSFLRNSGFCDEKALRVAQRFAITSLGDTELIDDDQREPDRTIISRCAFNSLMRAVTLAQRSDLVEIGMSDISNTKYADIPLFRCDSVCYRPLSACERSAYEHLWYRVSASRDSTIEGTRVVNFAVKSGLSKETLSKCWSISLNESGRRSIQKDEFFVFLRCISFVQSTGISDITRDHISATADRDLPVPDFDDNDYSLRSEQAIKYPSALYFPQTKFEIQAYNDLWMRASNVRAASACKDSDESYASTASIGAVDAVTFVVTSRLQRAILKVLWAVCSPTAGPVKDTRISREQFNVLLRGISLAQQFPTQPLTAESINRSALMDLRLPCFEFQDDLTNINHDLLNISSPPKGPRPPPLPPKTNQPGGPNLTGPRTPHSSTPQSRSGSVDSQTSHADKSFSTMTASPNRNITGDSNELLVNLDSPFSAVPLQPTTVASLSRNGSLGAMPAINNRGANPGPIPFTPTIVDSILVSMSSTPVAPARGGSINLLPDASHRAGSIGPMLASVDTDMLDRTGPKSRGQTPTEGDKYSAVHPGGAVTSGNSPQDEDLQSRLCVCGDVVERFKPDCVRLRCKCMIHTGCLAQYIKSQLDDATSISGEGIRCCYWHSCHSYISMDDVDKFSAFIGKAQRMSTITADQQPLIDMRAEGAESEIVTNFGSNEVDKFTRYAVAASFEEKDLVYCPSCSTPFWVDEDFTVQRVFCQNLKCGEHFCRSCQVLWHYGMDCKMYQLSVASDDKLSHHYVAATSKKCPSCSVPFTHYHGHSCHHISPVGIKGGGCPACHVHFCYACLSTAEENIALRGDRKSCRCPKGKWSTFCESSDINRFLIPDPYPHDSRCGCPICPDCRYQKPCGGLGYSGSSCDGTCVVCTGLVPHGPLEIFRKLK